MAWGMVTRGEGKKHGIKLNRIKFHLGMLKFYFFFLCVYVCVKAERQYIKILTSANSKKWDIYFLYYISFLNFLIYHNNVLYT